MSNRFTFSNKKGVTLIELMIVITLIFILAGSVMIKSFPSNELQSYTVKDGLYLISHRARLLARTHAKPVNIHFYHKGKRISLEPQEVQQIRKASNGKEFFELLQSREKNEWETKHPIFVVLDDTDTNYPKDITQELGFCLLKDGIQGKFLDYEKKEKDYLTVYPSELCDDFRFKPDDSENSYQIDMFSGKVIELDKDLKEVKKEDAAS